MENGSDLKAMQVAVGVQEGQAGVAASAEPAPDQVSAEMAVESPVETTAVSAVIPQEEPQATTPEPSNQPYNYWSELEQRTEGLVKDEDSLSTVVERAQQYEALRAEKEQLEKSSFKPANDWIATLNDMTLAGAGEDQIKAFVKLNGYGKLEDLSPIDLKVTKMVLKDGYSESIARKIVNREYDLSQFDEDIPEHQEEAAIMRERLRISAKADLEALNEYKKELSTVRNPDKEAAEQARLQQVAELSRYNAMVEREAADMAKHFPEKLSSEFKIGNETIQYEDTIDKEFREKELSTYVKEYYKDSMDPVNNETLSEAYSFALGEYLKANYNKIVERALTKGYNLGEERATNRFENRSGLPKAQENQIIATNESGLVDFTKKMVGMN